MALIRETSVGTFTPNNSAAPPEFSGPLTSDYSAAFPIKRLKAVSIAAAATDSMYTFLACCRTRDSSSGFSIASLPSSILRVPRAARFAQVFSLT